MAEISEIFNCSQNCDRKIITH